MHLLQRFLYRLLRFSERYTKTDMVYLVRSSFWINLNFFFVSVFSLLLSIAFANLLPKEEYGIYQYVLAIAAFLTAFSFTGMNTAIAQAVARGYEGTLRVSIKPQLLWNAVPAFGALVLCGYYLTQGNTTLAIGIACVALSLPILQTFSSYSAFLNGRRQFRESSLYLLGGNIGYYLFIFSGAILFPFAAPLIAINQIINAVIALILYRRTITKFAPNDEVDPDAITYARHVSIMNVLNGVAAHLDKVFVFHFMGAASLAAYGLATLMPERLAGVFKALLVASLPRFAERDLDSIKLTLFRRLIFVIGVTLFCAIIYAFLAPLVLPLLYPAYLEIIPYSQLYALIFIGTAGHVIATILYAQKRLRELYLLNTIAPVLQILLQLIGVIFWGLWGVVGARVLSALCFGLTGVILLRNTRG